MASRNMPGEAQFHPVPHIFLKDPRRNCVLVGDDPVQLRFFEQSTGLVCEAKGSVTDEDFLGRDGALYRVLVPQNIRLSPQVRLRTGVYSLAPIAPGSAGADMLVRAAIDVVRAQCPDKCPDKAAAEAVSWLVGRAFERGAIADLRAGLWEAFWALTGPLPPARWKEPWENPDPREWAPAGLDLGLRLGALFKALRAYTLLHTDSDAEARKLGLSPHRLARLRVLHLRPAAVRASLRELSRWRHLGTDPRIAVLALAGIWSS